MTPRSEATSGWVTTSTRLAISAPIALASETLRAEVDDRERVARLDRRQDRPRGQRVDLLRALALVGREQDAEALLVRVQRLLQVAHGDLVGDLDEVDHRAPVRHVEEGAEVALLEVEVDDADRPARRRADGGERELEADGGRADAALRAGHGDQLAAERRAGRLLPGDAVAHRPRPLRGGAHAAFELLERERERDDVAQAGLHGGAEHVGRVVGGDQDEPDLREARGDVARDLEHRHGAERVVEDHDVDLEPAQRARQLLGVGDAVDHLSPSPSWASADALWASSASAIARSSAVLGHPESGRE